MDPESTTREPPRWLTRICWIGPLLLYVAATAYGILEVHSSTDTWIGLAAGRQILTADEFPRQDTFSYTFYGQTWYNQNWLTHLIQYWLYSRIGPNAVIYFTWLLSASVFALVLAAAYWRSGSWLGALLAAAVVGLGCRDFLSARPATTGFFCLASLWALLCAVEGQGGRQRWWPIALLLPLLLFWGNAHGSFVFGYGALGLFVGNWFVSRTMDGIPRDWPVRRGLERLRLPRLLLEKGWLYNLALVLGLIAIGGVWTSRVPPGTELRADEQTLSIAGITLYRQKLLLPSVLLVAYVVYWLLARLLRPPTAVTDRQALAILAVVVVAFGLTAAFGPFGIENFTHGQKVAGSKVFRQVSEWWPPFAPGRHFPPVWRFKLALGGSAAALVGSGLLWLALRLRQPVADRRTLRGRERKRPPRQPPRPVESDRARLHSNLFDVTLVVIGLAMTLWARRFAPIYFIFGAPVFLVWILRLWRPIGTRLRAYLRLGIMVTAGLLGVATVAEAGRKAYREIALAYADHPEFNLLERVTRYDLTPHEALVFLNRNELRVNLLCEWTQAGVVMFRVPGARVFMDGRAQQVYDELHYRKYYALLVDPTTSRPLLARLLDEHGTEAVLLRRAGAAQNLWTTLLQSGRWIVALMGNRYGLFLRRDSSALAQLGERLRRGEEWRPNTVWALACRGFVWQALDPPDLRRALTCWRRALQRNVLAGELCFRPITRALLDLEGVEPARKFVSDWHRRLNRPIPGLSADARRALLKTLNLCWNDIDLAARGEQGNGAGPKSDDRTDGRADNARRQRRNDAAED